MAPKTFNLHLHSLFVVIEWYPLVEWYARGFETHTTSKVQNFQGNQKSVVKIINSKITISHTNSTHMYRETTRINNQKNILLNEGKEKNMLQAHAEIITNMAVITLKKVSILEEVIIVALFSMLETQCLNTQMNIQIVTTWRTTKAQGPHAMRSLWWNLWISCECHDFSNCFDFYDKFGLLKFKSHPSIYQCICWNTIKQQWICNWVFGIKCNCTTKLKRMCIFFNDYLSIVCSIRSLYSFKWMLGFYMALLPCLNVTNDNPYWNWMRTFHDAQEQVIVHSIMTSKELHVVDKNIYKIVSMNVLFTQQTIHSPHIDLTTNCSPSMTMFVFIKFVPKQM